MIVIVVMLVGALVLGLWWWSLRHTADPIDSDPVGASAIVVSSPSCGRGDVTTVRIPSVDDAAAVGLSGCGFIDGQRVAVQYLKGHPDQVRLAGTSTAGAGQTSRLLLPYAILAAGLVAVIAAIMMVAGRRRAGRRRAGRRASAGGVSVDELRARLARAREVDGAPAARQGESPAWRLDETDDVFPEQGPGGPGTERRPASPR